MLLNISERQILVSEVEEGAGILLLRLFASQLKALANRSFGQCGVLLWSIERNRISSGRS